MKNMQWGLITSATNQNHVGEATAAHIWDNCGNKRSEKQDLNQGEKKQFLESRELFVNFSQKWERISIAILSEHQQLLLLSY